MSHRLVPGIALAGGSGHPMRRDTIERFFFGLSAGFLLAYLLKRPAGVSIGDPLLSESRLCVSKAQENACEEGFQTASALAGGDEKLSLVPEAFELHAINGTTEQATIS